MSVGSPEWYTHIYLFWIHRHAILLNPNSKTFAFLFWVCQWIFGSVLEKFTKDKKRTLWFELGDFNQLEDFWTWGFSPTRGFPQVEQKVQTYLGILNEHSTFHINSQISHILFKFKTFGFQTEKYLNTSTRWKTIKLSSIKCSHPQ